MDISLQNLIVLVAVLAAVVYLARTGWNVIARRKAAACGGCDSCPAAQQGAATQVVSIGGLSASRNGAANHGNSNGQS